MRRQLAAALLATCLAGCGTNVFQSSETSDPAEDATLALENDDPDTAIDILEAELEDDPTNYQYVSILSLAYAQRAGVEPLRFAQAFADNLGGEGASDANGQFSVLFNIMPVPTVQNLSDITTAVNLLASIPLEERLPGDDFKLAMFQMASIVMQTKVFDGNFDGTLTETEVQNMSDAQAAALLAQLDSAEQLLAAAGEDDKTMQKAAQTIAKVRADVNAQEGETDEEKLRNYLASKQNGQGNPT